MKRTFGQASIAGSLTLAISACVSVPTGQVIQAAGPQPTVQQAEAAILKHLRRALLDPDSMKNFRIISGPDLMTGTTAGKNYEQAWLVCAEFNSKNAYGGYTGLQTHSYPVRFSGEELLMVSTINWTRSDRRC